MNRLLLRYVIALFLPLHAYAQLDISPMVVEGRVWHYARIVPSSLESCDISDIFGFLGKAHYSDYSLKGDTLIGGQVYNQLRKDGKFVLAIREEGSRIFSNSGNGDDIELYNFSLEEGDLFEVFGMQMLVRYVDTVTVNGVGRRRLFMSDSFNREHIVDVWVEGIGAAVGGPCSPFAWGSTGGSAITLEVYQDSQLLFTSENFLSQSYLDEISKVQCSRVDSRRYFNLQGRRLNGVPQRGMYIRDGRKYVVK